MLVTKAALSMYASRHGLTIVDTREYGFVLVGRTHGAERISKQLGVQIFDTLPQCRDCGLGLFLAHRWNMNRAMHSSSVVTLWDYTWRDGERAPQCAECHHG